MKKMKKMLILILILTLLALTAGCTNTTDAEVQEPEAPSEIVLKDVLGREVILDEPAVKIVGTHNPTLNAAVVLGGGGKYIGGFGNKEMSKGLYEKVIDGFDGLTQIGKGGNINYETVLETGADLALIPERFKDQVEQFEGIGLNVLVALPSSESFDTVKDSLTLIGSALGESEKAVSIIAFLDERIDKAAAINEKATNKPSILFLGGSSPLSVAPDAMIQTQLIDVAGGINAVSGVDGTGDFVEVNLEQIIGWNPQVIWFPAYASYTVEDLINDPAWSSIDAIKNNKVYVFPSLLEPWDQPTAALALGISWATYNLHPDQYTLEELMADSDAFYSMVYGKTFTAEELGVQ